MREKIPYLKDWASTASNCAGLRVRRVENYRTNPLTGERLCNYWGYSTVGVLRPEGRLRGDRPGRHAGRRVQGAGQGAAPERHRGHPRCGLQPHRRGQRARPDHLLPRAGQPHLLHAHAGRPVLQLQRLRQHPQLQPPGRPRLRARLPALLGGRVPHRRLPLRPGQHPRPRRRRHAAAATRRCWRRWRWTRCWARPS